MRRPLLILALLLALPASADDRFTFIAFVNDSSITSGALFAYCDQDSLDISGGTCFALRDITVLAMGVRATGLTATTECGRVTLQVEGTNQSSLEVIFGNGNVPTIGHCDLTDSDFDGSVSSETCVRRGSVDIDAGEEWAWVFLNMPSAPPSPCAPTLTVFNQAVISMEFVNR